MVSRNPLQEFQDKVEFDLVVNGVADWRSLLLHPVMLDIQWGELSKGSVIPCIASLRMEAELNHVSFERAVMSHFLTCGYILEELEVEFSYDERRVEWGKCVWYKEHPRYREPLPEILKGKEEHASLIRSMFKTEHAGEQEFSVLSLQMIHMAMMGLRAGVLLHKTLVFRKAVLSPPKVKKVA